MFYNALTGTVLLGQRFHTTDQHAEELQRLGHAVPSPEEPFDAAAEANALIAPVAPFPLASPAVDPAAAPPALAAPPPVAAVTTSEPAKVRGKQAT